MSRPIDTGESQFFDAEKDLWDAKLTPRQAFAMVRTLVRGVPRLRERGGFRVEVHRNTKATAYTEVVIVRETKEILGAERMILSEREINEHIILHELAHICANTVHGNLLDPKCGHGISFRTWCSILEEHWREIKRRRKTK